MAHRVGRKRSGGCHACRRMKVKCDETKPACTRCQKVGRTCPGYREDDDLFRSMNEASEQKVRMAKARQSPDEEASISHSTTLPVRSRWLSIPRTIATDLDHEAVCHFFATFTFPRDAKVGTTGHYEFLPDLYLQHPEATYLSEAIKACSLSNMANRSSLGKLVQRARKCYGNSLLLLNAALADPKLAITDEVLSTITLLGLYEMISGEKPKDVNWSSHRSGQAHLLRLRGEQQFATERGRSLFRLINSQLLYGDFVFWAETPLGIPDWPDDLYFTELGTSVMKLHRRIAETRRKTHEMLKEASSSSPPSKEQAEMLTEAAQRCLALDAEIQQRIDWVQPAFGPKTLSVPSSEESDGESSHSGSESSSRRRNAPSGERSFPAEIFVYHNVLTAISWNAIYCARIKLLMDVLTVNHYLCNNNFPPAPLFASNYIPTTLISAADFICNSVPCVFGDIDPEGKINLSPQPKMIGVMSLVWTLYSVSTIPGIEKRRIQWIKDQFLRAGTVAGLKHALNVAKLLPKT